MDILRNLNISDKMLGSGSYGSVFQATMLYKGIRRDVAVKKIPNDGEHYSQNARREHEVLHRLGAHENIVELINFTSDRHYIYIIMEFAALGDLDKYVENRMPDLRDKIQIMRECATGVHFMHSLQPQVIHRDIKPGNILLQSSAHGPITKICDFGLARIFNPEGSTIYMSTEAGTPMYRSPEQFTKDRKQYTSAVDVFSLGLLYMGLLNVSRHKPQIECIPESLYGTDMLPYAQHLKEALRHNTPMPALFTLNSSDKWPETELKAVITQMAAFEATDRMKIGDVENKLQKIMSDYCSNTSSAEAQPGTPVNTLLTEVLQDKEEMKQRHEQEKKYEKRIREMEEQLALVNQQNTPGPSSSNTRMRHTNLHKKHEREIEIRRVMGSQIQEFSQSTSAVTGRSLMKIISLTPVTEHNFNIKMSGYRFSYNSYNNKFFFPHPRDNCISCYTTTGEFVKSISLDKYKIECPRSVQPLTGDSMLVAAHSGLFKVGTGEGEGVGYCVHKGDCEDVHMCEGVVAVLVNKHSGDGDNGKVYLYDTSDLSTVKSIITLTHKIKFEYINTILISNDVINVSSGIYHNITVYSVTTGKMITEYRRSLDLNGPRLSVCDTEGSLLVIDWGNSRLLTLSAQGEWAVVPGLGDVKWPEDAVIIGDKMYILTTQKNIHVFKIT